MSRDTCRASHNRSPRIQPGAGTQSSRESTRQTTSSGDPPAPFLALDSDILRQRMGHVVAKKVSDQRRIAMNRQVVVKAYRGMP